MNFYLGTHMTNQEWWDLGVPLFVSHRRLVKRKRLPIARETWALDSGGFSELAMFGEWRTSVSEYVTAVRRYSSEIGHLAWVAPMDWMCEPSMLEQTGLTVAEHQRRTIANFLELRQQLGQLVVPVLQGWTPDDYRAHADAYYMNGVVLEAEHTVGLGTVCRRQDTATAGLIVRELEPLRLHGFGIKVTGLHSFGDALASADSMAWSYRARLDAPLPGCKHRACSNCPRYAMRWRSHVLNGTAQLRLEVA